MIKNLVTNKDIRDIQEKFDRLGKLSADEAALWNEHEAFSRKIAAGRGEKLRCCYESNLQIACKKMIENEYQYRKDVHVVFLQIDNGGEMKGGQRKRKKMEGTQAGWKDVEIKIWKDLDSYLDDGSFVSNEEQKRLRFKSKSFYLELKKIGGVIAKNQQDCHDFLIDKGESAHFCNNTVYFSKVIMKEIEEFLK